MSRVGQRVVRPRGGRTALVRSALAGPAQKSGTSAGTLAEVVLDAAHDPILALSQDGVILSANRAVESAFGWSAAELAGRHVGTLLPELARPVGGAVVHGVSGRTEPPSGTHQFARGDGSGGERPAMAPGILRLDGQHRDGAQFRCEATLSKASLPGVGDLFVCVVRDLSGRSHADVEADAARSRRVNDGTALSRLQEASTRLVPSSDGHCLLGHILDAAIAIDSAESGALQFSDVASAGYRVEAHCIRAPAIAEFLASAEFRRSPLGQAIERGERVVVPDVLKSPLLPDPRERSAFKAAGIRALHFTPLIGRTGHFLGVLSTHHVRPRRPKEHNVLLIDILARQVSDFIERARAERELRRSESRLRATLDSAVDAIVTIDGRGVIQAVNSATTRIFGFRESELVGQNVKLLMPAPYRDEHDGYIARYRRTGEKRIIGTGREAEGQRKDGTLVPIDLTVTEVEEGSLYTGVIRDITERRAAEARVRQADRMASIGTLAAGLGHDMNNVLLPVRARLNALRAEGGRARAGRPRSDHLDEIARSVSYLQQLADGLHFLAMDPEHERESGVQHPTDLGEWWGQTGLLITKAVPKHVVVAGRIPPGLAPVRVGAAALTQAVLNLVVNGGEAIPVNRRRGGHVSVWAKPGRGEGGGAAVLLGVTDDGAGMSEETRRRAFELFFTTKPRGLGTGLGLALVRRVVEEAGGSVSIDSQPGKGTTVSMTLPAVIERRGRGAGASAAPTAFVELRDERTASLVRQMLESSGCTLCTSKRVADAAIRIADIDATGVQSLLAWQRSHPHGRLVLVGTQPQRSRGSLLALGASIVDDPHDFASIRKALSQAVATTR